jgi:hypothetical protein
MDGVFIRVELIVKTGTSECENRDRFIFINDKTRVNRDRFIFRRSLRCFVTGKTGTDLFFLA